MKVDLFFINKFILLINLLLFKLRTTCGSHICSGVDENTPKDKFSTKTGYFATEKNDKFVPQFEKEVAECSAEQIWLLSRHGTRYPVGIEYSELSELNRISQEIVANHHQGRGCLNEETIKVLDMWFPPFGQRDKGQLEDDGFEELFSIGENWKKMFPDILKEPFTYSDFKVEFTIENRTGESAYHFLRGAFGEDVVNKIELPKPYSPNFLLMYYKSCPRWLRDVFHNNETTFKERTLFERGEEFQSVIHALSARLGYMHPLQTKEILAMYDECRYETAWQPDRCSPWCEAFGVRDIEVLEYHQDLKYYYQQSYGNSLNGEVACKTVSDLYQHFKSTISTDTSQPRAILYFAHDKTLFTMMTALGLFKPSDDLKHNNYESMNDRKFRTSILGNFAANLGFVLYKCGSEYRVATFHNGFPIPMPGLCADRMLCPWTEIRKIWKPIYSNCDLGRICMFHDEL